MNSVVLTKVYKEIELSESEIFRYLGGNMDDGALKELYKSCMDELGTSLSPRACYVVLPVRISNNECKLGDFVFNSRGLAKYLSGCGNAVLFAATVGTGIDRLITKYSKISPSRALMLDAIGTEGIEALCRTLRREVAAEYNAHLKAGFSPGYSDFSLLAETDIFAFLSPERKIGLTLNSGLVMSPSKSVTGIFAVCGKEEN